MRAAPKLSIGIAALLLVPALCLGCATQPLRGKTIRIGAVTSLSGEAYFFGDSSRKGYELALAEWNEAGGLLGRRLELVLADDRGDALEGAAVYRKLIKEDKVVGIVGALMSRVSLAGAPIAQAARLPMISPTSTNPRVTEVGDYIFRTCFIDPFQGGIAARFAYRELGLRRAAAFFAGGDGYAEPMAERFKAEFEALGGEVTAFEAHQGGVSDFGPELGAILRTKPELIYLSDYYIDAAPIARQARELGFTGLFLGGDGWDSPELVERGGRAIEGGMFTNHYSADDPSPRVQSFVARYRARFGEAPDALAALSYEALELLLDAIGRAGSTEGPAIRDALQTSDFEGLTGRIRFDADRNPIKSAVIIEIKGGEQAYRATVRP